MSIPQADSPASELTVSINITLSPQERSIILNLNLSRNVNPEVLEETAPKSLTLRIITPTIPVASVIPIMTAGDPLTLVQVTNTADDSETEPESESDHENTPAAPLVDQKAHDELTSTGVHWQAANNKADDSVTESETEAESEPEHESNHAHHTPVAPIPLCPRSILKCGEEIVTATDSDEEEITITSDESDLNRGTKRKFNGTHNSVDMWTRQNLSITTSGAKRRML